VWQPEQQQQQQQQQPPPQQQQQQHQFSFTSSTPGDGTYLATG